MYPYLNAHPYFHITPEFFGIDLFSSIAGTGTHAVRYWHHREGATAAAKADLREASKHSGSLVAIAIGRVNHFKGRPPGIAEGLAVLRAHIA